jgi:hypothetical protein
MRKAIYFANGWRKVADNGVWLYEKLPITSYEPFLFLCVGEQF